MALTPEERDEILITLRVKVESIERQLLTMVSSAEFWPVKAFVIGLAGLVLSGVGAAILRLVVFAGAK